MKISSILRGLLIPRAHYADAGDADWNDDPYAHPDIEAMTERERADLPPVHMPAAGPAMLQGGTQARVLRFVACALAARGHSIDSIFSAGCACTPPLALGELNASSPKRHDCGVLAVAPDIDPVLCRKSRPFPFAGKCGLMPADR